MAHLVKAELRASQIVFQACARRFNSTNSFSKAEQSSMDPSVRARNIATSNLTSRAIINGQQREYNSSLRRYSVIATQSYQRQYSTQKDTPQKSGNEGVNIQVSGWGNWIKTHKGDITKISGGGVLIVLIAGLVGYIYCENNPEKRLCNSFLEKIGIKKN